MKQVIFGVIIESYLEPNFRDFTMKSRVSLQETQAQSLLLWNLELTQFKIPKEEAFLLWNLEIQDSKGGSLPALES